MGASDAQEPAALEPAFGDPSRNGRHARRRDEFGEEEEARAVTQKQATRAFVSAWSNPKSRKYWLLRGKPLRIMAKAELQSKMDNQLAVTERAVAQLHVMSGFDVLDYVPKNLQGTQAGRDVTLLERFDILARALMEMLNSGRPRQPHSRSDWFCFDRVSQLKVRLDGTAAQLHEFKRSSPELLQNPASANGLADLLNRNLRLWSDKLANFSTDVGLRLPTHLPTVFDVPIPPILWLTNTVSLLSTDGTMLRFQKSSSMPAQVQFLSWSGGSGRSSPK